jgi:hypothetical protein
MLPAPAKELPPITGQLEPKIGPLVMAMREYGFRTKTSGDGTGWIGLPYVVICEDSRAIEYRRRSLIRWLRNHHVIANVAQVYTTLHSEPNFPLLRVEVFSMNEAKI